MVDTYQIHFTNGYNAGAKYRKNWKRAAKLLYQALVQSRKRCRRLQCRLDDQYEANKEHLAMYMSERDRLLVENTKLWTENTRLVNELLETKQR